MTLKARERIAPASDRARSSTVPGRWAREADAEARRRLDLPRIHQEAAVAHGSCDRAAGHRERCRNRSRKGESHRGEAIARDAAIRSKGRKIPDVERSARRQRTPLRTVLDGAASVAQPGLAFGPRRSGGTPQSSIRCSSEPLSDKRSLSVFGSRTPSVVGAAADDGATGPGEGAGPAWISNSAATAAARRRHLGRRRS
jgi:hypothetical protein